jgi:hypothetical protein
MNERAQSADLVELHDDRCAISIRRLRPGAVLVRIQGYDRGSLGTAPLDELASDLGRHARVELFIDAEDADGATWDVSQLWSTWFQANRRHLERVHILVGSKYVRQTIEVARELSRTGNLITIYSERERFERAIGT